MHAMRLTMDDKNSLAEAPYLVMEVIIWLVVAFFMSASWISSEFLGMVGCTHVNKR